MILVSVLTVMLGCSNPSLRVAYIDEVEERPKERTVKVYYSVLVKAVDGLDQEIYRIKLPGPVRLGEGKPENQNHAIIFTRGEGLQAIDMNQVTILFEGFYRRLSCVPVERLESVGFNPSMCSYADVVLYLIFY